MATPSTKATLKSYCLRALGHGVIDINVSDDQVDDRLDEALQYFAEYHYDGIERMLLKHQITSQYTPSPPPSAFFVKKVFFKSNKTKRSH